MWIVFVIILLILFSVSKVNSKEAEINVIKRIDEHFGIDIDVETQHFNVERSKVFAIIATESTGNQSKVGTSGEVGLMQLTPGALSDFNRLYGTAFDDEDIKLSSINIKVGTGYYAWLVKQFGGNQNFAIKAYNAGIGTIKRNPNADPEYLDKVLHWEEVYNETISLTT